MTRRGPPSMPIRDGPGRATRSRQEQERVVNPREVS
jgi:hypothetical protein